MSLKEATYYDLVCDQEGCDHELSAYTDEGYADEAHALDVASDYDWQRTSDGRDLCPEHRAVPDTDEGAKP